MNNEVKFIYGAQYYRAPTPEKDCWKNDLKRMKEIGFNSVKFWVQWRWSERQENQYYFDDIQELMDLAHINGLSVTLNIIMDVAPIWLYDKYPDAMQVTASGEVIRQTVIPSRQIGGFPGPCYNHAGALEARKSFLEAAVNQFKNHPALHMWDVWNEPEQCGLYRAPSLPTLVCYCPSCQKKFLGWLQFKYNTLDRLNDVWGRCYCSWDEIEIPLSSSTFTDFIDYREFLLDTMTSEANWRIRLVKDLDKSHLAYLHVVPNTLRIFNSMTCVDDFELAKECDVFGGTVLKGAIWPTMLTSAGQGKICYNAECHIANGSIRMHQNRVTVSDLLRDFIPQIGMGIRGFLFWQYRPEILGEESPAWGIVKPDGTDRALTQACTLFWEKIAPYTANLMHMNSGSPEIGIWLSRKNEIFQYAAQGNSDDFADSIEAYIDFLYWNNYPCRIINSSSLEAETLQGIKLLILPQCYYFTGAEAKAVDVWVKGGGVLLCEAHLAGYNATTGRHSRIVPGCGLAESWGICEDDSTSPYHLSLISDTQPQCEPTQADMHTDAATDVKKALTAYGAIGDRYFDILLNDGSFATGAERFAQLEAKDSEVLGTFNGEPCIVKKKIGDGTVIYCGTNIGLGSHKNISGFSYLLHTSFDTVGIVPTLQYKSGYANSQVHIDLISGGGQTMIVLANNSVNVEKFTLNYVGSFQGIYTGLLLNLNGETEIVLPEGLVDIFVRD